MVLILLVDPFKWENEGGAWLWREDGDVVDGGVDEPAGMGMKVERFLERFQ